MTVPRYWNRLMPGASRYRQEALISSLSSLVIYGMGILTGPVLARVLGPSGRGEVAAVMAPATLLGWLLPIGLPLAAAYFIDTVPERGLLSTVTVFGIAVGGAVCAGLWFVVPAYLGNHSIQAQRWARALLVVLPLAAGASAALEVRRCRGAGTTWNLWRSGPVVIPAVVTIGLALAGRLTVNSALAAYFTGGLVPLFFLWSRLRGGSLPRPSMATLRLLLPYAWRTLSVAAATAVTVRLDQVILAPLVTSEQLGLYVVAVTAASATNPFVAGLPLALFGHVRVEKVAERADARFRRSLKATLVVSGAVAVAVGLFAPWVLRLAFGDPFVPAARALRLLLPGALAFNVLGLVSTKLYAEGRLREVARAAVLGATLTILGLALFTPRYGIEAAAAVTSVAFVGQALYLVAKGSATAPPSFEALK